IEIVDAAEMNAHVRDNLLYLYQTAGSAHGVRLYKSGTAPTFTSGSANTLVWDNSLTVTDSMWSSGSRFVTVPSAYPGLWDFSGVISWAANTTGYRQTTLLRNGTNVAFCQHNANPAGNSCNFAFLGIIGAATDYFEISVK